MSSRFTFPISKLIDPLSLKTCKYSPTLQSLLQADGKWLKPIFVWVLVQYWLQFMRKTIHCSDWVQFLHHNLNPAPICQTGCDIISLSSFRHLAREPQTWVLKYVWLFKKEQQRKRERLLYILSSWLLPSSSTVRSTTSPALWRRGWMTVESRWRPRGSWRRFWEQLEFQILPRPPAECDLQALRKQIDKGSHSGTFHIHTHSQRNVNVRRFYGTPGLYYYTFSKNCICNCTQNLPRPPPL